MSIITAYNEAWKNGDVEALAEVIHDEFVFNPHVGGVTMGKSDIIGFVSGGGIPKAENDRILFENNEVGFEDAMVTFNDGNKEAVMSYYKFKDGKVVHQETGATKLPK